MEKIDFKAELRDLYRPSDKEVVMVEVPTIEYLMVDGEGEPEGNQNYMEAIEALYGLSYTMKFMIKKGPLAVDYSVMPLEGLWWAEDMSAFQSGGDRSAWKWTAMIMQPGFVTKDMVEQAAAELRKKKDPAALPKVRFEALSEGTCAQIMHIGPYSEEGPTIEKVHSFIRERGELTGKHHEIYLSDPRRTDPSRWKTIIRQPMTVKVAVTT